MNKRLFAFLCVFAFLSGNALLAKPVLTKSKYLIATLSSGAIGTVSPGTEAYPLVYYLERDAESALESDYWMIEEQENNVYSFRNASTLKYIRYDSSVADRTALVMTDALAADQSTLFKIELKQSGNLSFYMIRSVVNSSKVWDKRNTAYDGLYPVGVYSGSGGDNETFIFYDSEGNSVADDFAVPPLLPAIGKTLGTFQNYADSLLFNAKTPVVDTSAKAFYLTIPESQINGNVSLKVQYELKNSAHTLFINNLSVTNGANFNFGTVSAATNLPIEIRNGSTVVASGRLYFSCLPLVQVYSESSIGSVYNLSKLSVTEPEVPDSAEVMYMKIKIRGATSAGMPKKSYAVKLKEADGETSMDRSFLGFRNDNNWILDAMYIDPARMRNRVATDLWNDFSAKPYFYDSEPKLINGTRGKYVEVFINDAYNGLYCMTEKIDRKQLKLKKFETSGTPATVIQHGGLYKGTGWASGTLGGNPSYAGTLPTSYNNNSETWSGFEVKYPDLGDGEPINWKPLVDALTVSSSLTNDANFRSKVATYFDLPVFLDYYLFIELMLASDNQGKNTYFSVYNQETSPMVIITPWDCDGVWGRRWDGSTNITGANQDFDTFIANHEHAQNNLFLRLKSLNYDGYRNKLKNRYEELRGTHFSYENLMERFEHYHEQFVKSGADVRERNKWSVGNFNTEMQYLSTWIQARLSYLDNQYLGGPYIPKLPASIENQAISGITIAPNPVQNILTVSHSTAGDIIRIVSLQGMEIARMQSTGNDMSVDMTSYAPGIYLLKTGNSVSKVVKN